MKHPASHIIRQLLFVPGITKDPLAAPVADWSCYLGFMPDDAPAPDNAVAIYDTPGLLDGRLMRTGENIIHHGIQVKVRSKTYITGWRKIYDIAQWFEKVKRSEVLLEDEAYSLYSVNQVGTILSLGLDEGTKRRDLFTLNCLVTLCPEHVDEPTGEGSWSDGFSVGFGEDASSTGKGFSSGFSNGFEK